MLDHQRERVRDAADRLARQRDPAMRAALQEELRAQEELCRGLAAGLDAMREDAAAVREEQRTQAFLEGLADARARRVEGEERRTLIAEVRAKLRISAPAERDPRTAG